MIDDFLATWGLFHHGWIAGWCIAATMALLGVLVVARERAFLGAAIAQTSSLGVSAGLWLSTFGLGIGHDHHDHAGHDHGLDNGFGLPAVLGVVAGALGALATAGGRGDRRVAWLFLASSSLGLLLLTRSPHGMEEVQHLMASSIIGAGDGDQWLAVALLALTAGGAFLARHRLVLLAIDPAMAPSVGMDRRAWELGTALWLGVCLGFGIRIVGMLFVFGCLVLPALAARGVCREVRMQYVAAPLIALAATAVAFVVANHHDLPPAQTAIAALCLLVPLAAVPRALRRAR